MSAICYFLVMHCYMSACNDDCSWWSMARWLVVAILLVGCALLFKEQGITVVVCIYIAIYYIEIMLRYCVIGCVHCL